MAVSHASNPTNDSERLVFRQMRETLVRVDCLGNVHPGLAQSWQRDADGKGWIFTLREGATFALPDAKAWGVDSAAYLDERHVQVRLRRMGDSLPRLFADPRLAFQGAPASAGEPRRRFFLAETDGRPAMDFQVVENGDPRDALDRGIDLTVTRDPSIVDYVAGRPEFETFPLPWSLTYVLLQPSGAQTLLIAEDSVRRSLARDAVHAEARPAEPPFWWDSLSTCSGATDSEEPHLTTSRIVYSRDDEAARGLAERLVALAGTGASLRAAALEPAEFAAALRDGTERGFVVAAPRKSLVPCRDASTWPPGASIQPLIDTRARAIVRRGSPALSVDWDGTVRVLP